MFVLVLYIHPSKQYIHLSMLKSFFLYPNQLACVKLQKIILQPLLIFACYN